MIKAAMLAGVLSYATPAALSLPVYRQCLCVTAAGAWAVKPKDGKPCIIVCNPKPKPEGETHAGRVECNTR